MTFADLDGWLEARLGGGNNYWTSAERKLYLQEAFRTWNAAAQFYRDRATFNTAANTVFYDLTTELDPTLMACSLHDQDLITAMEYHLLEPPTPSVWTGTAMLALDDLTQALQRRRDQFLIETGMILTHRTPACPPPPIGRVVLASDTIDVRRAAWRDVDGVYHHLWREDEHNLNAYSRGWSVNPDTPAVYSMIAMPPWRMQVAPVPLDAGTLDLLVVAAGAELDPTVNPGVLLGIPDDFAWVVKWGALADLLGQDGPARDPSRSAYCESRWREGVHLARLASSVIQVELNGIPTLPCSVHDLDSGYPGWQNATATAPSTVALAGWNMLAVADPPDGIYSVTCDVVRNAPVPTADGDTVTIGKEEADVILGEAHHLACFKMGGTEFEATIPEHEQLLRLAALQNTRLRAQAANFGPLSKVALREGKQRPRRKSDVKQEPLEYAET